MAAEKRTVRELIEEGLRDTERLIAQKQYNLSMIRARQTLEYIVKSLCRRSGIADGDLMIMIDDLYRKGTISRDSCTNYHKIRILGNKAAHEDDNNAYNANTAYLLLSQEIYAYRSLIPRQPRRSGSSGTKQARRARRSFKPFNLLKLLIPLLAVILMVLLVRFLLPGNKPAPETSAVETTAPLETAPSEESSTAAPLEVVLLYTTTASLNVRSAPELFWISSAHTMTSGPSSTIMEVRLMWHPSISVSPRSLPLRRRPKTLRRLLRRRELIPLCIYPKKRICRSFAPTPSLRRKVSVLYFPLTAAGALDLQHCAAQTQRPLSCSERSIHGSYH